MGHGRAPVSYGTLVALVVWAIVMLGFWLVVAPVLGSL